MKDEYIIVNKLSIQERIKELEKEILYYHKKKEHLACKELTRIKLELEDLLSHSNPLIPEIEKAWEDGKEVGLNQYGNPMGKQNYIENIKIDI